MTPTIFDLEPSQWGKYEESLEAGTDFDSHQQDFWEGIVGKSWLQAHDKKEPSKPTITPLSAQVRRQPQSARFATNLLFQQVVPWEYFI